MKFSDKVKILRKENKKNKINIYMVVIASSLILLGSSFIIIKSLSEYVDEYGILHENFFFYQLVV